MTRRQLAVLLGWAAVLGSRAEPAFAQSDAAKIRVYEIFKGDRLVLTVSNEPGPLLSAALPPPGREPMSHPFLSASAHAPEEEPRLREILERAGDFADFIARLRAAGYTLRERTGGGSNR
jgi:hypothetical protein